MMDAKAYLAEHEMGVKAKAILSLPAEKGRAEA
jgi:hypothetical protein